MSSHWARLGLFLLLAALGFPASGLWVASAGWAQHPAAFTAVLATWLWAASGLCAWLGGARWTTLGLRAGRGNARALLLGLGIGALPMAGALLALGAWSGGEWQANPQATLAAARIGLATVVCSVLFEELLFRGYAFAQLQRLLGPAAALWLSALLFGAYHLLGSGDWAMGALFRGLMAMSGGLVFGYALQRSGSLVLPIGLHCGGNAVQAVVLGLGQPVGPGAMWVMPLNDLQARALTAPDLLPHLPYLAALGLMWWGLHALQQQRVPAPAQSQL
jgi:hypothetical protein